MIDLLPDADQRIVIEQAAALLTSAKRGADGREFSADNYFAADLAARCAEQGWFSLALPEDAGGVGLSVVEQALVFREAGRALAPIRLLGAVLAAHVAAALGESDLLARVAGGEVAVGIGALTAEGATLYDPAVSLAAVLPAGFDAVHLVEVPAGAVEAIDSIDPLTRICRWPAPVPLREELTLRGADARSIVDRVRIVLAAYQSGIAEGVRDMSTEYVKQRVQFDSPIGAFQAVKHRCADMAIRAEQAWAQTAFAAVTFDVAAYDTTFEAAAAKYVASNAAIDNVRDNIQNHGAIGYTAEHEAHLYLGRAHVADHLLGGVRVQLAAILPEGDNADD